MMSKQECVELAGGSNGFGSVDLFAQNLTSWCFASEARNDPSPEEI